MADRPLAVQARKQRALLALLLLHANKVVSNDQLIEQLWQQHPPRRALKTLQVHVSQLRKLLEEGDKARRVIVTRPSGYLMHLRPGQLDLDRFRELTDDGRVALAQGDAAAAARLLGEALALWRGAPLADLAHERFAQSAIARLEELRLAAFEDRVQAQLALGRHGELVAELEVLVAEQPLRERLRGQLILALYRSGRQADALAVYRETRRLLARELAIEPAPELRALERAILNQDPALELLGAGPGQEDQLPTPPTSFVGRSDDRAALCSLLKREGVRLVTLSGLGGIGKTRLALETARTLIPSFRDGVVFVQLDALVDPALLAPTLARALRIPGAEKDAVDALTAYVRARSLLMVLDSFEHLLTAAPLLSELLRSGSRLKLLVTSRALLRISGEHEFSVPPLALPSGANRDNRLLGVSSVALFVERARAANPALELTPANVAAIAAICRRLEGLPLSIELAAARARMLRPASLLERLGKRLDVLTSGLRDAPARQQTLRATIDWSYHLLSEDEQRLFVHLAVFTGGFTLEGAEAVCGGEGDRLDVLDSLIGKSLLLRDDDAEPRFRMLDTVREYARELLAARGEEQGLRRKHADWYVEIAESAERELPGPRQTAWLDRLEREHGNLRAALTFALEADPESAFRLGAALRGLWLIHGHLAEGRTWLEAALALDAHVAPELRTKVLSGAAILAGEQGDLQAARHFLEETVAISREAGPHERLGQALHNLGMVTMYEGNTAAARALFGEALALHRETGDEQGVASALANLASVAICEGRLDRALALLEESESIARRSRGTWLISSVLRSRAHALLLAGDGERALDLLTEALTLARQMGGMQAIAESLEGFAGIVEQRGECERAATLLGAAAGARGSIGAHRAGDHRRSWHEDLVARIKTALAPAEFEASFERGRTLSLDEASDLARGLHSRQAVGV